MVSKALFLLLTFSLAASLTAFGQDKAKGDPRVGDPRVTQQLDRMGIQYSITESGNYSMKYDLDGGRTQTVYIMGQTEKYKNTEIRELWSRAGTFDSVPSADVMQKLLEESGTKEIGFWGLEKTDDGSYIVYFSVKVPVYLRDSDLSSLLELTANVTDQKEAELFNDDQE